MPQKVTNFLLHASEGDLFLIDDSEGDKSLLDASEGDIFFN